RLRLAERTTRRRCGKGHSAASAAASLSPRLHAQGSVRRLDGPPANRRAHRGECTILATANTNDVPPGARRRAAPANPTTAAAAAAALPECSRVGWRRPGDARRCPHEGFLVANLI